MSYALALPDPVRHKIAGWNLPPFVELVLLEAIEQHAISNQKTKGSTVRTLEVSASEPGSEITYGFYVYYTGTVRGEHWVFLDIDIECLPDCSCERWNPEVP